MDANAKCPNCGAPLPPGAMFCESCGRRVEAASAAPSTSGDGGPELPFEMSAALPKAMRAGRRSLVRVRFRAKSDMYESVEFALRNGDEELSRRPCCPGRPLAAEHEAVLDVVPKACGTARIALDVECRLCGSDDVEMHTASLEVAIDDKSSASFSPVFNISQNQTSDRAGDTRGGSVNVNFDGLHIARDEDPSRYETPTAFVPLRPSLRKSPPRLTLRGRAGVVQLLSDDVVSFGRNRDNVIPLRVFGQDGALDAAANENNISRFHFRVMRRGECCVVADGGGPSGADKVRPSAYGTRVDGSQVAPAGSVRIEAGRDVVLGIGREDAELKMRLRFETDEWGRPAGVLIDRCDGARARVLVVWRDVAVSDGESVLWNGSSWCLAKGASSVYPMSVGTSVSIGGETFAVLPFRQTHLN